MSVPIERLFLGCLRGMPPKERPSSSTRIDEAVGMLCSASADLRKLESLLSTDTISLQWCCQAIYFLKIMHSQFCIFIEKSEGPRSWKGVDCFNLYMEEIDSLLDLFNLLKLAISGMDRYRIIAEFAARKLRSHELPDAKIKFEIENLDGESRKLYGVERWKDIDFAKPCSPKTKARDSNVHVIRVFKTIMAVISILLFSVLFYPISVKLDQKVFDQLPQLESISTSLQKLVSVLSERLHEIKDDSRPVLAEYKMIERAVLYMKAEILQGDAMNKGYHKKSADLLQSSSLVLRDGLQLFDNAVNEFFEEVNIGKSRLLDLFQEN